MKLPLSIELWLERIGGQAGGVRGWLEGNQMVVAAVCGVALVIALIAIVVQLLPSGPNATVPTHSFYYDVVTGTVFSGDASQIPPIQSPDGNVAVRVLYYSCGDCSKSDRFVGYYEKFTPQAKAELEEARARGDDTIAVGVPDGGMLISFDGKTWLDMYSPEGEQGMSERLSCANGGSLRYCVP